MIPALLLTLVVAAAPVPPETHGAVLANPPARATEEPAAPTDTLVRIPGSAFRLGWTHERAAALGTFTERGTTGDVTVRRGDVRWFGTTAPATLTYRAGRLAEVRIECDAVSPRMAGYVPDELRREGYRCVLEDRPAGVTEWSGPARVTLTTSPPRLIAEFRAREPAPAAPPEIAPPAEPVALDLTAPGDSLPPPRIAATPGDPVRPRLAIDAGVFGRVHVRARVDTTGRVVHAEVARGIAELNQAAIGWASQVRFDPYRVGGRAVPFLVIIPVAFLPVRPTP